MTLETRHLGSQDAEDHPLDAVEELGVVHVPKSRGRPDPGLSGGPAEKERHDAGDHYAGIEVLLGTLGRRPDAAARSASSMSRSVASNLPVVRS